MSFFLHASFVEFWTTAFVEAFTPQNILSGFKSCAISPFDPAYFLQHLPPARLKKTSTPPPTRVPYHPCNPFRFSQLYKSCQSCHWVQQPHQQKQLHQK